MIRFLKEDFFPIAFMFGFITIGYVFIGKFIYPTYPKFALGLIVILLIIALAMILSYWQHMEKRKREPQKSYEIESVLILSTGHLTQYEFETMKSDDEMPFRIIEHEYGKIIILYDLNETIEFEDAKGYMLAHFPKLWRVLMFAKGLGCRYVNFDQDGEEYENLPKYKW